MSKLLSPYRMGPLSLANRVVMAPMTRSRAINNIPNELIAEYYAQRASAGLIITEGTSPSPNGLGYSRIPGIFSDEQVAGWKKVTDAVHGKDGKIVVQLMHTGRVSHPKNLPKGAQVLAPSSVGLKETKMWVDGEGLIEMPLPKEMTLSEIRFTIGEYVQAAQNAVRAGFDGVELHGANGYLIKQFLNPHTNTRTDAYGGSIENRSRFLLEIVKEISDAIGSDKIGVRISPFGQYNETPNYDEAQATYLYLAQQLNDLDIAYLHVTDQSAQGASIPLYREIRREFKNTLILSGGYDAEKAEVVLAGNEADLVAFGRPFISNPDLVDRFKNKLPISPFNHELFFTPGAEGFVDYPVYETATVI